MNVFAQWLTHCRLAAFLLALMACTESNPGRVETNPDTRDVAAEQLDAPDIHLDASEDFDSEDSATDAINDSEASTDEDNDGVPNIEDACPAGSTGWTSNTSTDVDSDGCRDSDEDTDDDNDGVPDTMDGCPKELGLGEDDNGDGCTDIIIDTDADGVADDVDVCPGFYDPEQIDLEEPFGQGDVCRPECTTIERIEIPGPHELDEIGRTILRFGLQPPHSVRYWYKYDGSCGTFSDAYTGCDDCSEHYFTHGFSAPATVVIRQDFDDGRCVVRVARSEAPPDAWMRIEVSAFSDDGDCPDGAGLRSMIVHPDNVGPDLDGDGLPEPYWSNSWSAISCIQYRPIESYCDTGWGDVTPLATASSTSDDRSAALILLEAPYPRISLGVLATVAKSRIEVRIYNHETLIHTRVATDIPPFTIWDAGVLTTGINRLVPAGVCQLTGRLCSIDADCGEGTCVDRFLSVPPFD